MHSSVARVISSLLDHLPRFVSAPPCRDLERIIGWLTIALGVGALIPRQGLGLYMALAGWRLPMGVAMIAIGAAVVICARSTIIRRVVALLACMACWIVLSLTFVGAALWGATGQAIVVISFIHSQLWRLFMAKANAEYR